MADSKTDRAPRVLETRESTERRKSWQRPTLLPDPPEDPDYAFKWVRVSTLGVSDPTNMNSKLREGWEFVSPDDPVAQHIKLAATDKPRFSGTLEIGGLVLAKMPKYMRDERNAYFTGVAAKQIESVDNAYLKDEDPRMKKSISRQSKVSSTK